jgi:hypothetical protein
MTTFILTQLDPKTTEQAVMDLKALKAGLVGSVLKGNIGPRTKSQRKDPNAIRTFRYVLPDGTQTMITHEGDHHLRFVHEEADGPTRRVELEEVLPNKTSRASLGKDASDAMKAVQALVEDLDPVHDIERMRRIEGNTERLKVLLRLAMIETIGRRSTQEMSLAVAGRIPSLTVWDDRSRATWRLSEAGREAVNALTGSACLLFRKTQGSRDWLFQRRRIQIASNEEMDRLDGMETLRLHIEAKGLISAMPFTQQRMENGEKA